MIIDFAITKQVYNRLQDDESRSIFKHLLLRCLDGNDYPHIFNMLEDKGAFDLPYNDWQSVSAFADTFRLKPAPIVAFGAGHWSEYNLKLIEYKCVTAATALCDSNLSLENTEKHGYSIISPKTLVEKYNNAYVVISTRITAEEIYQNLLDMGFGKEKIFWFAPLRSPGTDEQYFGMPFLKHYDNEIFVDVGAGYGETISGFIRYCGDNYKKIYAFEPDPYNFERTQNHVYKNNIENVSLLNKGAWSEEATLPFNNTGWASAKITDDGAIKIPVTTIDKVVCGERVTFIKMDTEGAEHEALKGAAHTIQKHKPKLAISVYHKPEDILQIPACIYQLNPDYKFYLRQHTASLLEIVLYAVM
jgi:FkbM family methyltransferase